MSIHILIDGLRTAVPEGASVAAVLAGSGTRRAVGGQLRAPFCGMGVCFECRVTIDGRLYQRACQVVVCEGMEVRREA